MHTPRPHVILIAYFFPPSTEMGALRPSRFHRYLKALGYRCHVVTAALQGDNCPEDIVVLPDELHDLWEKGVGRRSFSSYVELLLRRLFFPGHLGLIWSWKAAALCRKIMRDHPNEEFVVLATYPPLGTLLVGLMLGRKRIPWIADFRDPIAERESASARFWSRVFERRVFHKASAVIANVDTAAEVWRARYPWLGQKLHVIYNGFDPAEAPRARAIPSRNYKLIVHAGTFYAGRNVDAVLYSLARLRTQGAPEALAARVLLLGVADGDPAVNWALCREALQDGRLELRPPPSWDEWERVVGEADGLLVAAHPQNKLQVPGKLYGYICVGRPVLALLPKASPVEPILQNAGVPYVCIYHDEGAEVVDRKLLEFLRLPNQAAPINEWFRAHFDVKCQTERLAQIIDSISQVPGEKWGT